MGNFVKRNTKYDEWHSLLPIQDFVNTRQSHDETITKYLHAILAYKYYKLERKSQYMQP